MRTVTLVTTLFIAALLARPLCGEMVLKTDNLRLVVSDDATLKSLRAEPAGIEYAVSSEPEPIAKVFRGGSAFSATEIERAGNRMTLRFKEAEVEAVYEITSKKEYLAFKLVSLAGKPVDAIEFMRLKIKKLPHLGYWINAAYDDKFGVCLCAGNVRTDALMSERALCLDEDQPEKYDAMAAERLEKCDHVVMRARAHKEVGLEGAAAVLFGFPRPQGIAFLDPQDPFLDTMEIVERDFDMPAGAKFRRDPLQSASWIEIGGMTPDNVDQYIAMAKRGGFRILKMNWGTFSSGPGHFAWNGHYPNGMADLKKVIGKIHAAGLKAALHLHYNKATKSDAYVTPVPDDRLNKVRHFTLAQPVDAKADKITVNENPAGCTKDNERRILQVGKELISYKDYTTQPPYQFTGCERGHLKTAAVPHAADAAMDLLDVDTYYLFIRYAQDNDIQDETARRFADIQSQAGPFDMIYFDGAEDVPAPLWYHVPNSQHRMFRQIEPQPALCEAAVNAHYSWHMNPRSNAYDAFPGEDYKDICRKVFSRTAPLRAIDFSRCAFGWLYKFEHTPDTLEYVTSRAAAWDSPCCFLINGFNDIKSNPRWQDCLEVVKIWEDIRAEKKLTEAQRKMLRTLDPDCYRDCDACEHHIWCNVPKEPGLSEAARKRLMTPDQEHHLFRNEQGEFELVEIHDIPNVLFDTLRAYWFSRESRPDDTYVLIWAKTGSTDLHLPVAAEKFSVMRPFGKEIKVKLDKDGQPVVEVGSRMYMQFKGMNPQEVKEIIGGTTSAKTKMVTHFLPASAFTSQSGDFVSAAKAGNKTKGALSDCMAPTVDGTFEAWEKCYIDYQFDVPERGTWRIWARIWCGSAKSDSFFTSIPGDQKSKTIFGNQPVWKKWLWQPGPVLQLEKGQATIRFWVRDAVPKQAPLLDVIFLTNCPSYTPNDQDASKNLKQQKARK